MILSDFQQMLYLVLLSIIHFRGRDIYRMLFKGAILISSYFSEYHHFYRSKPGIYELMLTFAISLNMSVLPGVIVLLHCKIN